MHTIFWNVHNEKLQNCSYKVRHVYLSMVEHIFSKSDFGQLY
jgi:hypothetical protein